MKKYGEFSKDSWEYHIHRPDTPKPWFNYLFNDKFHSVISQTGGGFNYAIDPKVNRILRYDNVDTDLSGRYLFIKEEDEIWSANWQPLKKAQDKWLTVFGPGYTFIRSEYRRISVEMRFFVPLNETMEIWSITVKNNSDRKRKVHLYPFIDVISGDVDMEARYRNIMKLYNVAYFDRGINTLMLYKMASSAREFQNYSYFMSSLKPVSYETEKLNFFGQYHTVENPEGLKRPYLSSSDNRGEDMIGAFQYTLDLAPRQEKKIDLIIGFSEKKGTVSNVYKRFIQDKKRIEREFQTTRSYWKKTLEKLWIETGDVELDRMINIWGKYQLLAITRWRGSSAYHGTEGGLGYRDLAQDVEGIAGLDRVLAREKIMDLLHYQYSNGNAVSGFSKLEGAWDTHAAAKMVSGKSDVAVWLPNAVAKYIKETGDTAFLRKKVPYLDKGEDTVYRHVIKAVEYVAGSVGRHGLPLIKIADWNDAYDKIGRKLKGESVWLGEAVCWAALIVKELAEYLKDLTVARRMEKIYQHMKGQVNRHGWTGHHYFAAYNDQGRKIGDSHIPLNSQTWAILGRVADKKRMASVVKAIDYLDTPYGNALFKPPYHRYEPDIGRVTAFAEGTKENAACFSHAIAFKVVADCMINRNNKAYQTIKKLIPTSEAKQNIEKYKVEPFVWAEYVIGPGNKYFGQGAFTWNTGTAVWTYIGVTDWILGIKPHYNGLKIDPRLPDSIRKVKIKRIFRGCVYHITIQKSLFDSIRVDEKAVEGNIIPAFKDGKEHQVRVFVKK
ncbi:MAG: hypothetical protein PHF84_07200 [bacterium]|nr:hypothetical protein [bacterium]